MTANASADPITAIVTASNAGEPPLLRDVEATTTILRGWLRRRGLQAADLDEVCAEAIRRLYAVAPTLDVSRPAGAWLRVVADHLALDLLRRHAREPDLVELDDLASSRSTAGHEDAFARMLDAESAASDVRAAMRTAVTLGRADVIATVQAWLFLAEANGEAPTSREVGERLGVSHTTVRRSLQAFADFLRPSRPTTTQSSTSSTPPESRPVQQSTTGADPDVRAEPDVPASVRRT